MDAMDWNLTSVGLPNTCSRCGALVDVETGWYAPNVDAARAGGGVCAFDYEREKHVVEVGTQGTEDPVEQHDHDDEGAPETVVRHKRARK